MKKLSRRNFLKKTAISSAGLLAGLGLLKRNEPEPEEPAPFSDKGVDWDHLVHPYFLDKGWKTTFLDNDLEVCVWDEARCKWLSMITIEADDQERKRAIWG